MSTIRFTREHEWIRVDGGEATVGITDFAQSRLGDVVYVQLPSVGQKVVKAKETAVVESVKAASDVYAPVSGDVTAINPALAGDPGLVNRAAMGDGWFFKLKPADPKELDDLMDETAYSAFVKELG